MVVAGLNRYIRQSVVRRGRMQDLVRRVCARVQSELGASLVEYVLLVTFIAMAALLALAFFGNRVAGNYSSVASEFPS